jgi:hypothetical protein
VRLGHLEVRGIGSGEEWGRLLVLLTEGLEQDREVDSGVVVCISDDSGVLVAGRWELGRLFEENKVLCVSCEGREKDF